MFSKFANKTLWSFYYFSKKALPHFIIFGSCLFHKILQKCAVFNLQGKNPKARGLFAKSPLSSL
jgi:hypothetical protein